MSARYFFLIPVALLLSSCIVQREAGPEQYDSKTIDGQGAESARVEMHMGAGDLRITDGAQQLARADFTFNVPSWKPEVTYTKSGTHGELRINQPKDANTHIGHTRYRWEVQLSNKIPLELNVHFGAGQARLDVGSLQLKRVDVHMGVGQMDMDLRGRPKQNCDVTINGGVGEAVLRVSADAGVYAEAHGGIGSIDVKGLRKVGDHWESDSYSQAANKIRIQANGGIGAIRITAD